MMTSRYRGLETDEARVKKLQDALEVKLDGKTICQ